MKHIQIKRIYKGTIASVRDYQLEPGVGIVITSLDQPGKRMTLSAEAVDKKRFQTVNGKFASKKQAGQSYGLVDFAWVPDKPKEADLFEGSVK